MHSTACGIGATSANTTSVSMQSVDGLKMVHTNDDAMNKIPLKSSTGLDDEEKNGGEFINDTSAADEARRERMRVSLLKWMKKLTIVLICFIGIALISYVLISLCFSDWSKSSASSNSTLITDDNDSSHSNNNNNNTTMTNMHLNSTSHQQADRKNNIDASNIALAAIGDTARTTTTESSSTTTSRELPATVNSNFNLYSKSSSSNSSSTTPTSNVVKDMEMSTTIKTTTISSIEKATTTATTSDALEIEQASSRPLQDMPIMDAKFESKLGVYENAAVCSDKEVCSQIGSNILEQGGSAVDAAIATLLCNGILIMQSMGIGGGMLMNIYLRDKQYAYSVDAREVAPWSATPEMFDQNPNDAVTGGLSIAVPGELMGYYRAHERFGKLPWRALVEPSLKICRDGIFMTQHHYTAIKFREKLRNETILRNVFIDAATGEPHPVGTKIKPHKELCDTYALLAENGPLDFYNGTLAKLVAADLEELGSPISMYDLETYAADMVSSITMQLGSDILYVVPPVSSGTIVANILSILEGYNFTKADLADEEHQATTIHRFAEAFKFAFAKRGELGDLRFNDVRELISKLMNPESNADIRQLINDSSVGNSVYDYGGQYFGNDEFGTSHTVVLAPNGDAVSVTSSVNWYFGGGIGKRTGIIFNDGMFDFSIAKKGELPDLPPSPSNTIDAHKRAMSSMSPIILADQDGNVKLLLGAAGGAKIITAVAEVAARVLWFDQDIKEAIDAPRFHHQLVPNELEYEYGRFSEELLSRLKAKGHRPRPYKELYRGSIVCGLTRNDTAIYANADFRKYGGTAGY